MTMLECRVGLLQDLFPGNCAGFFNVKRNQQTRGWGRTRTVVRALNPGPSDCKAKRLAITLWGGPFCFYTSYASFWDDCKCRKLNLGLPVHPSC